MVKVKCMHTTEDDAVIKLMLKNVSWHKECVFMVG